MLWLNRNYFKSFYWYYYFEDHNGPLWFYRLHFPGNFCLFKKMHHYLTLNKIISISIWSPINQVKLFISCISCKTISTFFCNLACFSLQWNKETNCKVTSLSHMPPIQLRSFTPLTELSSSSRRIIKISQEKMTLSHLCHTTYICFREKHRSIKIIIVKNVKERRKMKCPFRKDGDYLLAGYKNVHI